MIDRAQQRQLLGRIVTGMEVCDITGDKIGTIARIHHVDELPAFADDDRFEGILELKTGFLGLGHRLYFPLSVVQEVFSDTIFLSRSKEDFESLGYATKPAHIA